MGGTWIRQRPGWVGEMTDAVRVVVLGTLTLGVIMLSLSFKSLRGQIDDLRAEVACLRIESLLGDQTGASASHARSRRPGVEILIGAVIGAASATGATWLLWG